MPLLLRDYTGVITHTVAPPPVLSLPAAPWSPLLLTEAWVLVSPGRESDRRGSGGTVRSYRASDSRHQYFHWNEGNTVEIREVYKPCPADYSLLLIKKKKDRALYAFSFSSRNMIHFFLSRSPSAIGEVIIFSPRELKCPFFRDHLL